ncbi:MAG: DNA-binding domain-containing protein [Candidatus Acidiferrales bacterium]
MKLLAIQRRMARAVMTPLTRDERMRTVAQNGGSMRAEAAKFIKPNDRLTSFERLEIYNRQYWFRVLSGFAEDFPGLRAVLGERKFDAVSKAYIADCPSESFTLRNLGSRLEMWLRKHPKMLGDRAGLAIDMARLEWADIDAFDGLAEPGLKQEDLAAANPAKLRLRLQPHIHLLDLNYPVDDLLLEVRKGAEELNVASNAFSERQKKKRVRQVAALKTAEIFLAVHRVHEDVFFRRLEREEFVILSALVAGRPLAAALDAAWKGSKISPEDRQSDVQHCFQTWSSLGWFCHIDENLKK